MSQPIQFYKITLKDTGEVEERPFSGTSFFCTDATAQFLISFDGSTYVPCRQRAKIKFPPADAFSRFWLKVVDGTVAGSGAVTVQFYAAVAGVDIDPGDIRNSPTVNKGFAAATIAATSNAVFYGTGGTAGNQAGAGYSYRKAITVTNNDPGSSLEIWTADGTTSRLATVFHTQAWVQETSDDIMVKNETGSAIACRVMEVFYPA